MAGEGRGRARKQVAVYLAITFAVSGAIEARIFRLGGPIGSHAPEVFALMWTPAFASMICRLVFREGVGDVSFRLGRGVRPYLVAWLLPTVVGLLAYGAAWVSGLDRFEAPTRGSLGALPPAAHFLALIAVTLAIGPPLAGLTAVGEEIGWRGYMLTRLVDAEIPHPLLVSGLIWGAWHLPLILSGQYAAGPHPNLSAALFMVDVVAGAIVAGYARLETGSVWAAALFHSSWNATIQGVFDRFTHGGGASTTSSVWVGESGVLVAFVHLAVALFVVRRGVLVRRRPADASPARLPLRAL